MIDLTDNVCIKAFDYLVMQAKNMSSIWEDLAIQTYGSYCCYSMVLADIKHLRIDPLCVFVDSRLFTLLDFTTFDTKLRKHFKCCSFLNKFNYYSYVFNLDIMPKYAKVAIGKHLLDIAIKSNGKHVIVANPSYSNILLDMHSIEEFFINLDLH